MDDQRFDNVARALGGGTTRRGVFRVLAAGAAGGFGTMTGSGAKAAPGGGKGKPPCCPTGYDALCPVGGRPTCTNTRTDASNCGTCGTSCPTAACAPTASAAPWSVRRGARARPAPPVSARVSAPGPWSANPTAAATRATRCRGTRSRRPATASTTTATARSTRTSIS